MGLDAGKYFWRSGREKCFSLDIPFNRTFGQNALLRFFANSGISRLAQLSWLNVSLDFSAMLLEVMQQYLFGVVRFVAVFAVP
jgi:hypothetical protein